MVQLLVLKVMMVMINARVRAGHRSVVNVVVFDQFDGFLFDVALLQHLQMALMVWLLRLLVRRRRHRCGRRLLIIDGSLVVVVLVVVVVRRRQLVVMLIADDRVVVMVLLLMVVMVQMATTTVTAGHSGVQIRVGSWLDHRTLGGVWLDGIRDLVVQVCRKRLMTRRRLPVALERRGLVAGHRTDYRWVRPVFVAVAGVRRNLHLVRETGRTVAAAAAVADRPTGR